MPISISRYTPPASTLITSPFTALATAQAISLLPLAVLIKGPAIASAVSITQCRWLFCAFVRAVFFCRRFFVGAFAFVVVGAAFVIGLFVGGGFVRFIRLIRLVRFVILVRFALILKISCIPAAALKMKSRRRYQTRKSAPPATGAFLNARRADFLQPGIATTAGSATIFVYRHLPYGAMRRPKMPRTASCKSAGNTTNLPPSDAAISFIAST